jgi:Fe2+ or Zn2+ uptake regulation protein
MGSGSFRRVASNTSDKRGAMENSVGEMIAGRGRAAKFRLTRRRLELVRVFDEADRPLEIDELCDRLAARGARVAKSSVYRLVADLVDIGLVVEIHAGARRQLIAAHKTLTCYLETPDGTRQAIDDADLRALMTRLAAERGQAAGGAVVVIRFET